MSAVVRAFRAYPTLLKIGFAEALAYRAEMLVWILTTTMPLVSLALWSSVAETAPVGRFTSSRFSAYFLATLVVRQLTSSWLVWELNQDIRTGTLSRRLLRPIHPLVAYSAENLAALPLRAAVSLPIALGALYVLRRDADLFDGTHLVAFAFSIVGAWCINFFSMAAIGCLAFFVESSTALFEIWLVAFMLLSGYLLPLELFPGWLRTAADVLPFRYTLGFPVEIATGLDARATLRGLGIEAAYVVGMAAVALLAWRAGMRRFSAFGG